MQYAVNSGEVSVSVAPKYRVTQKNGNHLNFNNL